MSAPHDERALLALLFTKVWLTGLRPSPSSSMSATISCHRIPRA